MIRCFAWRRSIWLRASSLCVGTVLILSSTLPRLAAQPYGLESRPAVGPFLNGALPSDPAASFPPLLSQTGAFSDVAALTPSPGLIPFDVNSPLWTDGALKWRWIAVPTNAQIAFATSAPWVFPPGTVLVKHFELGVNDTNPAIRKRIETRLLIVSSNGAAFGATYRWRADHQEADLLAGSLSENITVQTATGTRKQRWSYPSPSECLMCHNSQAGFVLGPKTAQLNRDLAYAQSGVADNQLRAWNHLGLFGAPLDEDAISGLPKMFSLTNTAASLEARARSHLDSNCAHCHRPGGPAHATFDARYELPLAQQGLINGRVSWSLDVWNPRVIAPGDAERSMILSRLTRQDSFKMPPLGRNVTNAQAEQLFRAWINGMPREGGPYRLVATGAEWKFLDDDSAPDTTWRRAQFNDDSWLTGAAELGFGDGDEMTPIGNGPLVTAYFRRTFTVANASLYTNVLVRLLRDDGAVVYLNSTEVLRSNLPEGSVSHDTLALTDVAGDAEFEFVEGSIAPSLLVEGTNVIAVEVHQSSPSSDDLSFDLDLLGWVRPAPMLAPPWLEVPQVLPGGAFRLWLHGVDGQPYVIEASINLNDWQPRWTNSTSGGVGGFVEPSGAAPFRFYRARQWP
jgi:uncharacterized repeat protein (TIGR03806 family)